MCSASICLWSQSFRPPQMLPRSKESLTQVFLELFSTGCPIGFTQVGVESWISFDIEAVKWNLICVQWALYAPISNLVDFRSLNFVQRFKSRSSQSSWHCQQKSFQSKFWILWKPKTKYFEAKNCHFYYKTVFNPWATRATSGPQFGSLGFRRWPLACLGPVQQLTCVVR